MRLALATCALGLSLALVGCGNGYNSSPANLSGNWDANLQQASGTAASFSTTLTEVGVSGTWTVNGVSPKCSGSGGFTMTRH